MLDGVCRKKNGVEKWSRCGGRTEDPPKGAGIEREGGTVEYRTRTEQTVKDVGGRCSGSSGEPHSGAGRQQVWGGRRYPTQIGQANMKNGPVWRYLQWTTLGSSHRAWEGKGRMPYSDRADRKRCAGRYLQGTAQRRRM